MKKEIVKEARKWLGTKFHHQGRVRGVGCDCIGLIIGVVKELKISSGLFDKQGREIALHEFDRKDYGKMPDGFRLKRELQECLNEVGIGEVEAGDILLFRFEENPQHVAIATDYNDGLGIIHCYMQAEKVVEHRLDDVWQEKLVSAFRIK